MRQYHKTLLSLGPKNRRTKLLLTTEPLGGTAGIAGTRNRWQAPLATGGNRWAGNRRWGTAGEPLERNRWNRWRTARTARSSIERNRVGGTASARRTRPKRVVCVESQPTSSSCTSLLTLCAYSRSLLLRIDLAHHPGDSHLTTGRLLHPCLEWLGQRKPCTKC